MARIKRRSTKKSEGKLPAQRPTRQEAEVAALKRKNGRQTELPVFQEVLSVNCIRLGKKEVFELDFSTYVQEFPKFTDLIHQLQVAIREWSKEAKSPKTVTATQYALQELLEFLNVRSSGKPVSNISDISASVMRAFLSHLGEKIGIKSTVRRHYTALTVIFKAIQKSRYSELPEIGVFKGKFPVAPRAGADEKKVLPPLDQQSFNDLVIVLQDQFDYIKKIPSKVESMLADGQPTLAEINRPCDPWSELPHALWFYHHRYLNAVSRGQKNNAIVTLKRNGWSTTDLKTLYAQNWEQVKELAKNPTDKKAHKVVFDREERKENQDKTLSLVLKEYTEKYSDFPLQWNADDAQEFLRTTGHQTADARYNSHPAHELWLFLRHLKNPLFPAKQSGIGVLLFHLYPTHTSISVCLYLLKVQTGWNLSVLLDLEFGSDFDSLFRPCPVSQDYALLVGEKARGTLAEKYHRSKKNNKYGAYRILKFLWDFGKELRAYTGSNSPWVFLKTVFAKDQEITNVITQGSHTTYARLLCNEGRIRDNSGNKIDGFAFESIRKNLAGIEDELSGYDIEKLTARLQNTPDVALSHYRSKEQIDRRLRTVQSQWVEHFTYFQGSFVQASTINDGYLAQETIADVESSSTVQIITTDGVTPVAICKNPFLPDWLGSKTSVGPGERCVHFHGCSNCSQCVVFSETLPFIHRRLQIIDQIRNKMNVSDWESAYHIEWFAWKEVLEHWPDQDEVAKAKSLSRSIKLPVRPQLYGA